MPSTGRQNAQAPDDILIHRGRYYFCSRCSHLMTANRPSCPRCGCTFASCIEEEERLPDDPARLREIDEDYSSAKGSHFFLAAIIAMVGVAATALLLYFLAFRR
ncbi:MAG: hypothetical protein ABIK37_01560 [candidate division WOR-3 bacterium]